MRHIGFGSGLLAFWALAPHALLFAQDSASAEPTKWSIEESQAPQHSTLDFEAREGTWISVDVSPDGEHIVFDLLGHLYQMPIAGGDARPLTEGRSWNMYPRYSPDGSRIAFTSDRGGSDDIWILEIAADSLWNLTKSKDPTYQPSWSEDGSAVYAASLTQGAKNKGHRYNLFGKSQVLVKTGLFQPVNHFQEDLGRGLVYFEVNDQQLYQSGARIRSYDLESGEIRDHRVRPGGAFNPVLSPDHRLLAYTHRDDRETVVVLQNLETGEERILIRGLDRDHQGYRAFFYGLAPNMAWHPNGESLYLAFGGAIWRVDIDSGELSEIAFRAPVKRSLDATIRFPIEIPEGEQKTLANRFAIRTDVGILFESLGDLYQFVDGGHRNLTDSPELESAPLYDPESGYLYYCAWSDSELGSLFRQKIGSDKREQLTSLASHYSSLALSPGGSLLAYVRGGSAVRQGERLDDHNELELVVRDENGRERQVTEVSGKPQGPTRLPLSVRFRDDGKHLVFTEFSADTLVLKQIGIDGEGERTLYRFPHSDRAVVSPDFEWIAFSEYGRGFITPFEFVGKTVSISAFDKKGFTRRIDHRDGSDLEFTPDGRSVTWSRGGTFFERLIEDILSADGDDGTLLSTQIAVPYQVDKPGSSIALTGARVITMNQERQVLEDVTILIDGNRIAAVGSELTIPEDARVFDLSGHTVMPGLIDAHAHYGSVMSQTNVIELTQARLASELAHGVTTLYELYGSAEKDSWTMDMLRSGKTVGPRLFSTGPPIYGLRFFRPNTHRPIKSVAEAREQVSLNRDAGATAVKDYVNFKRVERHQLATAARELGMNVFSETAGNAPMNFTQIIDGVTGLEHSMGLTPLYQDVIELFKASKVGVTPTLLVVYNGPGGQSFFNQTERLWENEKLLRFVRRDMLTPYRRVTHFWPDDLYAPEMAAEMKKLFDAGVLVNMGGHGQMFGLDAHWEMELFVQGGFTPHEAIQTATINSAAYHGLDRDLGSIEAGKLADLVVMSENPLDDIRNSKSIVYVIRNGVVFSGVDAARIYPEPAPAPSIYYLGR